MTIHIDAEKAEKILLAAFKTPCKKADNTLELISSVISGTHKTYKYILVNGLLAKATVSKANPLALQAGAPIKGAFDARSLCHNVLVPFERNFLQNALGGSNEPFLNKPARFTHLSNKNAVRDGNDRETLNALIEIFTSIKTSADAERHFTMVAFRFTSYNTRMAVPGAKPTVGPKWECRDGSPTKSTRA